MTKNIQTDILLVGGGIMSATLGTLLRLLNPALRITMVEQLPAVALESSEALNNAGTGHAGYCELNYTPQAADGSIQIKRALEINAAYEISLQLWAHLVKTGALPSPNQFINRTPHLSLVFGDKNSAFLKQRFDLLSQHALFAGMQFSADFAQLKAWMPLIMQARKPSEKLAATYVPHGSDVDFGALTRALVAHLQSQANFDLMTQTQVQSLRKISHSSEQAIWQIKLKNTQTKQLQNIEAKFVFLGAGGGALPLLQKANIDEAQGYGGFPVSGQWLICQNPEIIQQHATKVYGKAAIGAPPMSVPHLDMRMIHGKAALLFGPFAGFTTKFLKTGSHLDLAKSIKANNLKAMLGVGKHHADLTKYLLKEATQTHAQRMNALREFLPQANNDDWRLENAGQRVQIIKNCEKKWGKLEFGTEVVAAKDGSLAALLGASPGASVSVQAMLQVIECCLANQLPTGWKQMLKTAIPSYGESLVDSPHLIEPTRAQTLNALKIL